MKKANNKLEATSEIVAVPFSPTAQNGKEGLGSESSSKSVGRLKEDVQKPKLKSFASFLDEEHGPIGTKSREDFQKSYEYFNLGELIKEVRIQRGLTQEQLAEKVGMNKSYISRIENSAKDIRFSTLLKIIGAMDARFRYAIDLV